MKRTTWGGKREGSGRKPTGRILRRLSATDEEWRVIQAYAKEIKAGIKCRFTDAKKWEVQFTIKNRMDLLNGIALTRQEHAQDADKAMLQIWIEPMAGWYVMKTPRDTFPALPYFEQDSKKALEELYINYGRTLHMGEGVGKLCDALEKDMLSEGKSMEKASKKKIIKIVKNPGAEEA
ncbi:MAG: hypothetical protein LBP78_07165 [Acidaminococcales bacterium]|jgi:hypothetical protein|nr:hypothetical protein [Acidaminococcales bacterium]